MQDGGDELMDVDASQAALTGTAAVPSGSQGQGQTTLPPRTGGAVSRGGGGKRKAPG